VVNFDKIILVTRRTRLTELVERFNSRAQAKFCIERAGGDFGDCEREDDAYRRALDRLRPRLARLLKVQAVDRALVPTMLFAPSDLVVTLGQDGLVANAAKYVDGPIVGVNPEPERFDGVLLPFDVDRAAAAAERVLAGRFRARRVTLAEAVLGDGQRLLAFNDLFLGARTHVSARYRITAGGRTERHSSSGVIVSTGAGSTGWLSSCYARAAEPAPRLDWEADELAFVVREPFASRTTQTGVASGRIAAGAELVVESLMPSGGCVFSDGVEADFLGFDAGAVARVRVADRKAALVVE